MAERDVKGWMGGSMKFGVGDEDAGPPDEKGPLLPLRVLVVAELLPRGPFNAGASAPEALTRVEPTDVDALFARLRPRVAIDVPSVLHEGRPTRVDLAPTGLKSFRPDGLVAEIPLLRSLLDGRLVLERLRTGELTAKGAEAELERLWSGSPFVREVLGLLPSRPAATGVPAATASAAPAIAPTPAPTSTPTITAAPRADANLDAILAMVDLDGSASPPASAGRSEAAAAPVPALAVIPSKLSALITELARSARPGSAGMRPTEAVQRVEKAIGAQIGAILQHPETRRLEQAWRGLRFLADRVKGHRGIQIDVICAGPEDAAEAFARGVRGGSGEAPLSFAVVDVAVDGTALGWSRLAAIAATAERFTVPVIVNGAPKLLGVDDLTGVEGLDNKAALFDAPHQAPWRGAAAKGAMRWLAIAMNGVLARAPYEASTSRVREAKVKELPDDEGGFVWMAPAYAVASLAMASFREAGWPCRIVGARAGGLVGDLPVRLLPGGYEGDEGVAIPTEAFISTESQRELAKSGLVVLASAPNSDAAVVMSAPTAYVPPPKRVFDSATTAEEPRHERVSLGDQLFVARLVQFLRVLCSKLPANGDPAELGPVVEGALWALLEESTPPPGRGSIDVGVEVKQDAAGTTVAVRVRPRRFLGVSVEEIGLELPLG